MQTVIICSPTYDLTSIQSSLGYPPQPAIFSPCSSLPELDSLNHYQSLVYEYCFKLTAERAIPNPMFYLWDIVGFWRISHRYPVLAARGVGFY